MRSWPLSLIDQFFTLAEDDESRGLNCSADGARLAGVPLLRKTLAGWAPRPHHDLAVLLTSAYGRGVDPTSLLPGLDVIAKALNRGDLGQAMIAAMHLKLPAVTWQGAEHIAQSDEMLSKFDPSEPRDDGGRWTNAGSADAMKPIRISDLPAANDNHPMGNHPMLRNWDPDLISLAMTRSCVNNALPPRPGDKRDYQDKVEECQAAHEKCLGLIQAGEENLFRTDSCQWPDGSRAKVKAGMVFPTWLGHPF